MLKQFFEVSMIVQNLSSRTPEKPFTLSTGSATLNLPEGLSLAPTTEGADTLTNEVAGDAGRRTGRARTGSSAATSPANT